VAVSARYYVLDSFALFAHLEDEAGAKRVREVLNNAASGRVRAYISVLNLGEIAYITERESGLAAAQLALNAIEQLPVEVVEATRERVLAAAHIKAGYPVSYGDAFAISAAQELGAILLTGDPEFRAVEKLISIEWLRRM
jgi:predicted nucleic acid-binding protein